LRRTTILTFELLKPKLFSLTHIIIQKRVNSNGLIFVINLFSPYLALLAIIEVNRRHLIHYFSQNHFIAFNISIEIVFVEKELSERRNSPEGIYEVLKFIATGLYLVVTQI